MIAVAVVATIGLVGTSIAYMIYPFIKYEIKSSKKKYKKRDIKITLCKNSLIAGLLLFLLFVLGYGLEEALNLYVYNGLLIFTSVFYYFINRLAFCKKKRLIPEEVKEVVEQNEEDKIEDDTIEEEVIRKKDTEEASSFMPYHDK